MEEGFDPKEFLLFALQHFSIKVLKEEGKMIYLEQQYTIEIEGPELFKLLQDGQVIAPFSNVESLCHFIKEDMLINE